MFVQVTEGRGKKMSVCFIAENEQEQRRLMDLVKAMKKDPALHLNSYVSTAIQGEDGANHVLLAGK